MTDGAPSEPMEEYESGPYCQHWAAAGDCEERCVCGHECRHHEINSDEHECCNCGCERFLAVMP